LDINFEFICLPENVGKDCKEVGRYIYINSYWITCVLKTAILLLLLFLMFSARLGQWAYFMVVVRRRKPFTF